MNGEKERFRLSPKMMKTLIIMSFMVFVFLIIVGIVQAIYLRTFSSIIEFVYTPADATVVVDGEKTSFNPYRVRPGVHSIAILKDGFEAQNQEISIDADSSETLYYILEPNSESTMNWYLEHEEDAKMRESIAGIILFDASEKMVEEFPATSRLPYQTSAYSIGYGACKDNTDKVCIMVTTERKSGIWSVALKRFKQLDEDLGRYNYEFIDYLNPISRKKREGASDALSVKDAVLEIYEAANGVAAVKQTIEINDYHLVFLSYSGDDYPVGADIYRIIMKKDGDLWSVVTEPSLVLTYENYPNVPVEIIRQANDYF